MIFRYSISQIEERLNNDFAVIVLVGSIFAVAVIVAALIIVVALVVSDFCCRC